MDGKHADNSADPPLASYPIRHVIRHPCSITGANCQKALSSTIPPPPSMATYFYDTTGETTSDAQQTVFEILCQGTVLHSDCACPTRVYEGYRHFTSLPDDGGGCLEGTLVEACITVR